MHYNRELSWLGFNYRVLQEAASPDVPLFERFRFLSIFSSNLDEFFRVRYPSALAISKLNKKTKKKLDGNYSGNIAEILQTEIEQQLHEYGNILTHQLLPQLEENGIVLYYNQPIEKQHLKEAKEIFLSTVLSFIQPIFFDSTPNDRFSPDNNQLYFFVVLRKEDNKDLLHSIVNIPSERVSRFFELSPLNDKRYIIFIDDIIRENMSCIFPGFEIKGIYSMKFNRDAELKLQEDVEEDMLKKIEKQLKKREVGAPSRFLFESDMPKNIQLFLANAFDILFEEMFAGGRYHNLRDFASLPVQDKSLSYPVKKPLTSTILDDCGNIFKAVEEKDILLHLPYDSYNPILSFFNQAAIDPDVAEIYITLYRVAADSHIVNALISAAKNGKKVVAFVELKARFDEENNIKWSRKMKDAGVRIVYSIPEIKVHSKTAIIVKNKGNDRVMYGILSTGNFNEATARFYTDHALLTANRTITSELLGLFNFLQESKESTDIINPASSFKTLLVSRFNMVQVFERLIEREVKKARKGQPALIRIKLNNLEEPHMIDLLYNASNAGVKIELIVRSICCLVPDVAGLSENITIKRIVDRYLEHTRIFIFGADNDPDVMLGSADWMTRNLRRRIEVIAPVLDKQCKRELIDYFDIQWQDNTKAVLLTPDMEQVRVEDSIDTVKHNAQQDIFEYLQERR